MYFSFLPWGNGEWPQFFPHIHPQRDPVFLFVLGWLFLFVPLFLHQSGNWVSVGGNKAGLEGWRGSLHLLLPGFNSVSVREKTIFSLKQ